MAETYSVVAKLSAVDNGFSNKMSSALKSTTGLGSLVKTGLGFGALALIGSSALRTIGGQVSALNAEIKETNLAWKNFSANMKMSGMSSKQIKATKKDLQDFAVKTIYTSKDMASTYAQLYAVSNKTTTKLVKGFGAVAAASENPKQAMKTISTQMTQMAAKPTAAWQDFRLIMEQSPAGIARIAKNMNMSAKELVANVQAGKVKTEDLFKAIEKCADDPSLMKMTQSYKTVGQAADGLRATIATGLAPAFDVLSKAGISIVTSIMNDLSQKFGVMQDSFKGVGTEFNKAFNAIGKSLNKLTGGKKNTENFKNSMDSAANTAKKLAKWMQKNSDNIAKFIKKIPQMVSAFIGFKIALKAASHMKALSKATDAAASALPKAGTAAKVSGARMVASSKAFMMTGAGALLIAVAFKIMADAAVELAKAGAPAIGVFIGLGIALAGLGIGMVIMAKALSAISPAKLAKISMVMLAFGGAVLLVAAGMWVLAQAAKTIADGGAVAVGVLIGMGVAIGLLLLGFVVFGEALTAAIPAMLVFGATVLMIGIGIGIAAAGIGLLAQGVAALISTFPTAAQYGLQAAGGIAAVSLACMMACTAVLLLGTSLLGMGVLAVAAGVLLLAAGVMAVAGGVMLLMFGIMAIAASIGVGILFLALKGVQSSLKNIAGSAKAAASSLSSMITSINVVKAGLNGIKSAASGAIDSIKSKFSSAASSAISSGQAAGAGFTNGLRSGLAGAPAAALSCISLVLSALRRGNGGTYSIGYNLGMGVARGLNAAHGRVAAAAARIVSTANAAMRSAGAIHSPSRLTTEVGKYLSLGVAKGIYSGVSDVARAASDLISMPQISKPNVAIDAARTNDGYQYGNTIIVNTHLDINGKEFAQTTYDDRKAVDGALDQWTRYRKGIR